MSADRAVTLPDCFDCVFQNVGQRLRERDIEVMRQNAPIQDDQQLDLPSGRHNFLVVHFPLVDEHGTLFAVGTLMTDITGYHLLLADENI